MNMLMKSNMQGDPEEITRFLDLLFRHCKKGEGFVALRAFRQEVTDEGEDKPIHSEWRRFDQALPSRAAEVATIVAHFLQADRAVFCPPVCLFRDPTSAKEANVLRAPAISVELDHKPQEGLETLRAILGEPTCIVASGGVWEGQDKLHLHWRLEQPANGPDLPMLKKVRKIATDIVVADPTNVPVNHPLRWPGSWHTKGEPRFCRIIGGDPDAEINLYDAYAKLHEIAQDMQIDETSTEVDVEGFKTKSPWTLDALKAAAARIDNPERATRGEEWNYLNKVAMAFYDASHASDDGLEALQIVSEKHPRHDPGYTESKWEHLKKSPPTRTSAGSLLYEARKTDPSFQKTVGDPSLYFEGSPPVPLNSSKSLSNTDAKPSNKDKRFKLISFKDAAAKALHSAAKPLIKGLLDQNAMTVLYGESNVGKTFVAIDIAYHVAKGERWAELKTFQFPVLYVAAEGAQAADKRAEALNRSKGETEGFEFIQDSIDLLHPDADLQPLISTVKESGVTFGLIVIDTLSRAMAGGDENGSVDMGAMVKHLDALRKETTAHILVVHHSGKDKAKGARGHSLLRAATDTEIEIADRQISVTKQRDMDGTFACKFDLDVIEIGRDGDGDAVTSCVVRLLKRDDVPADQEPTPRELDVLTVAKLVLEGKDEPVFTFSEIAELMAEEPYKMSKANVRFYLRQLVSKGHTDCISKSKWRLKVKKNPFFVSDSEAFLERETKRDEEKSEESAFD